MKKIFKRSLGCVFATVMSVTWLYSCATPANQTKISAENLDIWGCHASIKVLQSFYDNKSGELRADSTYYDDVKENAEISITMARGEYEGGQIIITPNVDVPYYNVTVSDLKTADGSATISGDQISVYKERYLLIEKNGEKNGEPLGYYPDALVPFEKIVEYKENTIKKDENQGIYMTVESALDQTVGTYTGTMTIDFKTYTKSVPISVEVVDLTVSEEAHAKSSFLVTWQSEHGELDTSQRMIDSYVDALIDYRLAPHAIYEEVDHSDAGMTAWVEKAYGLLKNPRLSNLSIPYQASGNAINESVFEKYLYAIAEKSFEEDFNMFKKLIVYNVILDEATFRALPDEQILENCRIFNGTVRRVADALAADTTITSEVKDETIESLRKLPQVCTFAYVDKYADYTTDDYVNAFCPLYNYVDTEKQREQYRQSEKSVELWWYGCNHPIAPYTDYHIEHATNLNTRLLSWMQAEYDIAGNLYWSANNYGLKEDYYDADYYSATMNVNMEGVLFYPGAQYGLDKPVGSLRLEGIRDGLEEYEILYAMKQKYQELGLPADEFISALSSNLYSGAQVTASVENFVDARTALLAAAVAANSPAELCVIGSTDNGDGTITTKAYIKDGYVLKSNGVALTNGEKHGDGAIYTVTTALSETANYVNLSYEADGKMYKYTKYLGGKVQMISAADFWAGFEADTAVVTPTLVEGSTIGQSGQYARLAVEALNGSAQMISFINQQLNGAANKNADKIVFNVYNASTVEIPLTISVKYKKTTIYSARPQTVLKPQTTTLVEIPLANVLWTSTGAMEKIRFWFGDTDTEGSKVVYVKDILIYGK